MSKISFYFISVDGQIAVEDNFVTNRGPSFTRGYVLKRLHGSDGFPRYFIKDSCRSKRETMQVFEFFIYSLVAMVIAVFPQLMAKHFGEISVIGDQTCKFVHSVQIFGTFSLAGTLFPIGLLRLTPDSDWFIATVSSASITLNSTPIHSFQQVIAYFRV